MPHHPAPLSAHQPAHHPAHPAAHPAAPHPRTPPSPRAVRARLAASIALSTLSIAVSLCLLAVQIYGPGIEFVQTAAALLHVPLAHVVVVLWAHAPIIALCVLSGLPRRRQLHRLPVTLGITGIALETVWMLLLAGNLILFALSTGTSGLT